MKEQIIIFFTVLLLCLSCNSSAPSNRSYEYYPNSRHIKSIGTYKGKLPIGELKFFYKNGFNEIIANYDSNGVLNGKYISYKINGDTDQIRFYKNDKINNYVFSYDKNRISEKVFFLENQQCGNAYFYNKQGKCYLYNFSNFNGEPILSIDYTNDSSYNNRIVFTDSILSLEALNNKKLKIDLALLISIPPESSTQIYLEQMGQDNQVIKKINIEYGSSGYYLYNDEFSNTIRKLRITATQIGFKGEKKTLIQITNLY